MFVFHKIHTGTFVVPGTWYRKSFILTKTSFWGLGEGEGYNDYYSSMISLPFEVAKRAIDDGLKCFGTKSFIYCSLVVSEGLNEKGAPDQTFPRGHDSTKKDPKK